MIKLTNPSTFENFPRSYKPSALDVVGEHEEPTTNPALPIIRPSVHATSISSGPVTGAQETSTNAVSPEISDVRQIWQDRGISTFHLATIQTQRLASLYILREPTEIVQFLRIHLSLVFLLVEVHDRINLYFPDAQFFLQFVVDDDSVEVQGNNGDLVVSIVTHLNPLEAVQSLEQFYEQ